MKIYIPLGFIMIFISLYYFYELNRLRRAKKEQRKSTISRRRRQLMDRIPHNRKTESTGDLPDDTDMS